MSSRAYLSAPRLPADARTLKLTDQQNWLVYFGLGQRLDHEEACAALEFSYYVERRFEWSSLERVAADLEAMRQCHEMRRRLRPNLFLPRQSQKESSK
jgi:hypothetical protein